MYKLLNIDGDYVICILEEDGSIIAKLTKFTNQKEAEFWCEKLNISYDIGYDHGMQLGNICDEDDIPQWLKEDIEHLALEEVRLSCAIHELYEYYANSRRPDLGVDEGLEYLDMVNERLDWIDGNTHIIDFAINNY